MGNSNKNGVWILVGTNTYSYDNMEQHIQVAYSKEEADRIFFNLIKDYLKEDKKYLKKTYTDNDLTLKEFINLALETNGDKYQYGIEISEKDSVFTISKELNNNDGSTDLEKIVIRLAFIPIGEEKSIYFIGQPMLDNIKDVEKLFKEC